MKTYAVSIVYLTKSGHIHKTLTVVEAESSKDAYKEATDLTVMGESQAVISFHVIEAGRSLRLCNF